MAGSAIDLDLRHLPALPEKRDYPIGLIGAGFIVADIQIPAYLAAGYNVDAIASRTPAHARAVGERHEIRCVHESWRALLDDDRVKVVDIAFPPDQQLEIVQEACKRPHIKGILVQKPIAANYDEAVRMVEAAKSAGKTLSVNQNMRYDQSMRALKTLLDRGDLGEPVLATIDMRAIPHWMPLLEGTDWLTLRTCGSTTSTCSATCSATRTGIFVSARPTRAPRSRIATASACTSSSTRAACGRARGTTSGRGRCARASEGDIYIQWRVEGTDGLARGTIGWPCYPTPHAEHADFTTKRQPGYVLSRAGRRSGSRTRSSGTMGALFDAMQRARERAVGR